MLTVPLPTTPGAEMSALRRLNEAVRRFTRRTLNPLMLHLAGRRMLHGEHDAVTAGPAGGDR